MRVTRAGISLLELLIACSVLLIMTTVILSAWNSASQGWLGSFRSTSRLSSLQFTLIQLENRLADAGPLGTIYQNTPAVPSLAFCSAAGLTEQGKAGAYSYRPGGLNALWQKYAIYYLENREMDLCYREIAIPSGDPAQLAQLPLDHWAGPSGLQGLSFYCSGGTAAITQVDTFTVERQGQILNVTLSSPANATVSGGGNSRLSITQTISLHG